jgi:hypothetical protein
MSKWASRILILSGLIQSAVITSHINLIINLYSTIVGFYMFGFVLFTIVNILNGVNFSSKKSLVTLITTFVTSLIQTTFAILYIRVLLQEISKYAEVSMDQQMITSMGFIGLSTALTLISVLLATLFYFKKTDSYQLYL